MIYLFCLNSQIKYIIDYIYSLLDFCKKKIKLIIKNTEESIYIYIKDNLSFNENNHYIIVYNNEINFEKINKLKYENNKLYILNTDYLDIDKIKFFLKIKIPIIDFNLSNIYFAKKHNLNIHYLPYQINLDENYNYDKIYDVITINKKNNNNINNNEEIIPESIIKIDSFTTDSGIFSGIISSINNENIKDIDKILFKYKILLNFNIDKENHIYNSYDITRCITNKILILSEKSEYIKYNELEPFILKIDYENIYNILEFIIKNYEVVHDKIFNNFDEKIGVIKKNIEKIGFNTIKKLSTIENNFGFILLRHVNSEKTNLYWQESYRCIRKFYSNKIIIIDDSSNKNFVKYDFELINCEIINSEYNYRGEILPYYYFYKNHYFDKMVIVQDSVFFNKYINLNNVDEIIFFWHFEHHWDSENEINKFFSYLNYSDELKDFYYEKKNWFGCFGVQSIIEYDFLKKIVEKYNLFNLLNYINNRDKRMAFERIFALICNYEKRELINNISLFGIIHHYIHWGYSFDNYLNDKKNETLQNLDLIKIWSGR